MLGSDARAFLKLCSLLLVVTVLLIPYLIFYPLGRKARRIFSYPFFKHCLFCAGLDVKIKGTPQHKKSRLYISNHVSYLDIPILASVADGLFIAKSDVAKWPVIGFLAKISRTHFVSRKATNVFTEREEIAKRLDRGESIFLFPEGSSSDGYDVLPFKPGLLSCALLPIKRNRPTIQPITIAYGCDLPADKRDQYAWYGDMNLAPHLWHLLGLKEKITVTLTFHQCECPTNFADRKTLAAWAEKAIRNELRQNVAPQLDDALAPTG